MSLIIYKINKYCVEKKRYNVMMTIHGRTKDCLEKRESWANAQYSWAVAGKT